MHFTMEIHLKLFPVFTGASRLIQHLYKHKIPMAVATGSHTHTFNLKITNHKPFFDKYFDHVVKSDDSEVTQGKPAPDIFLLAASRFSDPPDPMKVLLERSMMNI